MADSDKLMVLGAAYAEVGDAIKDYEAMQDLHGEGDIGVYDAALITKEPSGAVVVSNMDSAGRNKPAGKGALVGAVLGVVFPPSVLGLAALGAATGAAAGRAKRHLRRYDMNEIGELLEPGESGIIIVAERITDDAKARLFPRALRKRSGEVEGDAAAIKAAIVGGR